CSRAAAASSSPAIRGSRGCWMCSATATATSRRPPPPLPPPPPRLPRPRPPPAAAAAAAPAPAVDEELLGGVAAAMALVKAHRTHGHLGARLDPLGSQPPGGPGPQAARLRHSSPPH